MEASSEVRDTGMGAVLRRQRIETSSHQRERYYAFPVAKSALRTSFTFVILSGGAQSEAQSKDHYELDPRQDLHGDWKKCKNPSHCRTIPTVGVLRLREVIRERMISLRSELVTFSCV